MPPMPSAPPVHPPPDGGWGWIVVGAAFISIGFSYAFPKAVTVFFKEIQQIFHTTYSEIAWISSIMLAVMYAGGRIFESFLIFTSLRIQCSFTQSGSCLAAVHNDSSDESGKRRWKIFWKGFAILDNITIIHCYGRRSKYQH
ncbi:solute carrier family 16 member 7 [Homo sapiens]|uniref:Solute carrier family 16 member 7 n=1 Tax=Homo sapiens TaxID=9606 RepID=F8W1M4_HUMAN|nr:solute carrier family 16 member 7 [Homo sapiens]